MQRLDYIHSSGTQWINTGINLNSAYKIVITYQLDQLTHNQPILGCTHSAYPWVYSGSGKSNQQNRYGITNNSVTTYGNATSAEKVVVEIAGSVLKYGSTTHTASGDLIPTRSDAIILLHSGKYSNQFASAKLYELYIYDTSTNPESVVMHLIPVLDDNNIACMYDEVSQNYFYNAGQGVFTYEKVLLSNINDILTEKTNKIIPGNIKTGVTIFGVTGTYEGETNNQPE